MSMDRSRLKGFFDAVPATTGEKWRARAYIIMFGLLFAFMGNVIGGALGILHDNTSPNYVDRERAWCESTPGHVYNYYAGVCYTGVVKIPKEVSDGSAP